METSNCPNLTEELFARGLISKGCNENFKRFKSKLMSGTPITYAAIGGSITLGAAASQSNLSYPALFAAWLNQKTSCKFINAGVGATSSMFGAFRAQQEILCWSPDIITIEFAVNDTVNPG